jgi:thymidylate synthase (FAD)
MEITEPKVYMVSEPHMLGEAHTYLTESGNDAWDPLDNDEIADTEDATIIIEMGARLCYNSFATPRPGGTKALMERLLSEGHGSVLEHANWGFLITGVSRGFTHELVRHRAGMAYSQRSQRYVDESGCKFVPGHFIKRNNEAFEVWKEHCTNAQWAYSRIFHLIQPDIIAELYPEWNPANLTQEMKTTVRKAARGEARGVLPTDAETQILATGNARSWRNFIEQRANRHADRQARVVANLIHEKLVGTAPDLFGDYETYHLPDGTIELVTKWRKV